MAAVATAPEDTVVIQMPKMAEAVTASAAGLWRPDAVRLALRAACLLTSVLSLALTVSSEEAGTLSIDGFQLPLHSKWSFSESFEFLAGAAAAAAAHSLLQLLLGAARMARGSPVTSSRAHAWIVLACDQVVAYAMMSGASAAAGVTNLNRTGVRHSALPDFCEPLRRFCDRMAVSIAFAFLAWLLLAASAVVNVVGLSR